MPPFPLTPTRDAAPCPTFFGRTAEAVVGAADGISGGRDGMNYAAGSLPTGVTAVAMIAYLSDSNGLAIALADEGSMNMATAKSTCEAKTPAFTGGTWKLPTKNDWTQMFNANSGYSGLNTKLAAAGGNSLKVSTGASQMFYYLSSSEQVYLYSGGAYWIYGNNQGWVRACLAF